MQGEREKHTHGGFPVSFQLASLSANTRIASASPLGSDGLRLLPIPGDVRLIAEHGEILQSGPLPSPRGTFTLTIHDEIVAGYISWSSDDEVLIHRKSECLDLRVNEELLPKDLSITLQECDIITIAATRSPHQVLRLERVPEPPLDRAWLFRNEGAVLKLALAIYKTHYRCPKHSAEDFEELRKQAAVAVRLSGRDFGEGEIRVIFEEAAWMDPAIQGHLPILADALEEAGCTDQLILAHLRRPGRHYNGCWIIDRILEAGGHEGGGNKAASFLDVSIK